MFLRATARIRCNQFPRRKNDGDCMTATRVTTCCNIRELCKYRNARARANTHARTRSPPIVADTVCPHCAARRPDTPRSTFHRFLFSLSSFFFPRGILSRVRRTRDLHASRPRRADNLRRRVARSDETSRRDGFAAFTRPRRPRWM